MTRDDLPVRPAPKPSTLEIDGVVHDVNQMLMVIIVRAESLRRRGAPGDMSADLEAMETAARDAAAMLARLGSAGIGSDGEVAEVRSCVATAAGVIRPPGERNWSSPDAAPGPGVWALVNGVPGKLVADLPPHLVREVLNNLLLNALAVLPDGGRITVEAAAEDQRVHLWFSDDGPGVPPDLAPHVFAAGRTTSGEAGRGVGLAACRRILAARDASIELAPPRHGGATFVLDLPAAGRGESSAEPPAELPGELQVSGVRVLVVDDERAVREMLTDVLREWACQVTAVADGAAARAAVAAGTVDVALVDQNLPDGPGAELAAHLRGQDPALGMVVMTGVDRAGTLAGLVGGPVDATALKPMDLDELRRLVAAAADLARSRRSGRE